MWTVATLYLRGRIFWARWYRKDGSRASKSTNTSERKLAKRRAADLESEDRRELVPERAAAAIYQQILKEATEAAHDDRLDEKLAESLLTRIRRAANPRFRAPTVADHVREWCDSQPVGESTLKGYREMRDAVAKALGQRAEDQLADVTHEDCIRLLRKLKEGRTAATANQHFRAFRRALQSAVIAKLISSNPAEGVKPLPQTDSAERAPFNASEVRALMDHPDTSQEWRGAILFGAHTGLRMGDILKLGRKHVDGSRLVIRPAKTAKSRKTVTIPLTPPLVAWIGERKGDFFPTLKNEKAGKLSTWFKRLMKRAGVPDKVDLPGGIVASRSFHSLRHSFTSWLAEADIHADVRQKLTGHSSPGVHGRYTHHDKALDEAVKALPDL